MTIKSIPMYLLPVCVCIFLAGCKKTEPYKDQKLPVEERVNDLISRMTLDEKISQLLDYAPAIPRLGIPEYNWWNEGLHGVARAGLATVFPQSIGLAASFNDSLMLDISTVISDEFRAKYNDFIKRGERDRYKGLTVWSPNINIFRDPRWGRGQETYGEDPYLTSRMGVAFVKGLQGDHPVYYKTIATPKHYAVHSGPEPLRHEFDVDVSQRDFIETYLTAFEACVTEGNAQSVMSAYNRFRGESCTGSPYMLTEILRNHWGFEGYVVSDCGAVYDIYANHKIASSEAEAAAIALKAGCDLNCGRAFHHLKEAIEKGYCTEADIDTALKRLFTARFRLGMFDGDEKVPFSKIPFEVVDCPAHRHIAKEAARQSMVLLKNENHTLPLKKDIKRIAVIGPNANKAEVMYGNYNGFPSYAVTPFQGIKNKVSSETDVIYAQGCSYHEDYKEKQVIPARYLSSEGKPGLTGEYFNNPDLEGEPFAVRIDSVIQFGWFNEAPMPGMKQENYSVLWKGVITPPRTGQYDIFLSGDDGFRLFIDGKLFIDAWSYGWKNRYATINFTAGKTYDIRLEYYQETWGSFVTLEWGMPNENMEKIALEAASRSDVVVFVGGLSPELEGEEMFVDLSGFRGGDRTSIDLPEIQTDLLKKLHKLGKPVILVLMNGSAISVNWENANVPAILEAWYPGQEGGNAIADILFGDYNPAGRLPVTFYKSLKQLPPFEDYNMKGRTYRFLEDKPLYEFGYGLSYTSFSYSDPVVPEKINAGDLLTVKAVVTNTGEWDGDEVVQLYLKHSIKEIPVPITALQGFKRIHLKKGESRTVSFTLSPRQLAVINDNDQRVIVPEKISIYIGGRLPSEDNKDFVTGDTEITGNMFVIDKLDR